MESRKRFNYSTKEAESSKKANISENVEPQSETFESPNIRSHSNTRSSSQSLHSSSSSSQMNFDGVLPSTQHSTQLRCTGLTEEDAKKLLALLIKNNTSWVWAHFDRYIRSCESTFDIRAKCIYCKKADYPCDTSPNGTKSLITHLEKCEEYGPNMEKFGSKQNILSFENPSELAFRLNQKEITKVCVDMIVMDELPFSFVEGNGFRRFCMQACPKWKIPCRQTIAKDVLNMYYAEKRELRDMLRKYRVCITTDTWTSSQQINYMVITAHFIDVDWILHKKIISFFVIPDHKGESISRLLEECMFDWGIEKLLTVTVDNASASDSRLSGLIRRLSRWQTSNTLLLGGENLHVRCVAHILNLIVKEGLNEFNSCIQSIRNAIGYVRSSPQRLSSFEACVEKARIDSKGLVVMDVPTRWNSTYLMLQSALKFRYAFDRLKYDDSSYNSYFISDEVFGPPNDLDWKNAKIFATFLKPFYEITLRACCSNTPTIHHAFMDVLKIHGLLNEANGIIELSSIRSSTQSKYSKYWGDLEKVNKYFFVAIILDPRHKFDSVNDIFEVICGDDISSECIMESHTRGIKDLLVELYKIYEIDAPPIDQPTQNGSGGGDGSSQFSSGSEILITSELERKLQERSRMRKARKSIIIQNDVDRYLSDPIEGEEDSNFDILNWWRVNGASKYPILALIARDILAIPISTIASESCFGTNGKIIDSFRSSLSPKMVEALVCSQNWLSGTHVALYHEPTSEELEICGMIEKEMCKDANTMLPPRRS